MEGWGPGLDPTVWTVPLARSDPKLAVLRGGGSGLNRRGREGDRCLSRTRSLLARHKVVRKSLLRWTEPSGVGDGERCRAREEISTDW